MTQLMKGALMMENKSMKMLMLILVVVYAVAPDLIPGPLDDILVMALGYFATTRKEKSDIVDIEEAR